MGVLELPKDKRFSLAVIQGAGDRPDLPDHQDAHDHRPRRAPTSTSTTPRRRASTRCVEILGETAILRDLGSTNGTFIELERIEQQVLDEPAWSSASAATC